MCNKYIDLVPIIDTYGLHIRLANVKGQVKLGVETCCATPKNRYFFISSNRVMEQLGRYVSSDKCTCMDDYYDSYETTAHTLLLFQR